MTFPPETVAGLVRDAIRSNRHPAYLVKRGALWRELSWAEADGRMRELGNGLLALGVGRGDRVAILARTRVEWTLLDFATFSIGAISVPIYPTSSARDVAHILSDSRSSVVVCEDAEQAAKVAELRADLPDLVHVVLMEHRGRGEAELTLDRLAAQGVTHAASHPNAFDEARDAVSPDDPMTYIYTSGTTGPAKGCVLLHRNYAAMTRTTALVQDLLRPGDRALLFLPLAHTFARLIQFLGVAADVTVVYAEGVPQVAANLREVRPEIFPAVPRVLEKIHDTVTATMAEATGARARLVRWALRVGHEVSALRQRGRPVPAALALQHRVADRLVYGKIKARLGGNMRWIVTGGAPLAREIAEFFHAVDLQVLEGYGLTEATTALTINRPHRYRFGSVGPAFAGLDVRIAPDGEIELRGPTVFAGYFGDPDATAAALRDGWLATGDVGHFDDDGFLYVTDRKKDLIVTAGGKNVAPQNIENQLKNRPGVSQVVVIGDRRPYVSALVTLDPEALARVLPGATPGDDATHALVERYVDEVNEGLSQHERIRRFVVLADDFSEQNGQLTPSLKVKRRLVAERYADEIASLYESRAGVG